MYCWRREFSPATSLAVDDDGDDDDDSLKEVIEIVSAMLRTDDNAKIPVATDAAAVTDIATIILAGLSCSGLILSANMRYGMRGTCYLFYEL